MPRFCPQCGAPVNEGQAFCTRCGARLIDPEPERVEPEAPDISAEEPDAPGAEPDLPFYTDPLYSVPGPEAPQAYEEPEPEEDEPGEPEEDEPEPAEEAEDASEPASPFLSFAPQSSYAGIENSYSAPQSGYSAPQSGYSAPGSGYSAPQGGYSAPQGGYSAPQGGYSAPGSGYSAPGSGYGSQQGGYYNSRNAYDPAAPAEPAKKNKALPFIIIGAALVLVVILVAALFLIFRANMGSGTAAVSSRTASSPENAIAAGDWICDFTVIDGVYDYDSDYTLTLRENGTGVLKSGSDRVEFGFEFDEIDEDGDYLFEMDTEDYAFFYYLTEDEAILMVVDNADLLLFYR